MKIQFFVFSVLAGIVLCFQVSAQNPIVISEKDVTMSKGDQPAFIVEIPQANAKDVKKSWTTLLQQNTKSKVTESNSEIIIHGAEINSISDNLIDIYSTVFQIDSTVKLVSLFEIDGSFFSFKGDKNDMNIEKTYQSIRHFLQDFATKEYKNAVKEELKGENRELKDLNSNLKKLVKQTESYQKDIKKNEGDSLNTEIQIKSLEIDRVRKQKEIDSKKESMASLGDDKERLIVAKKYLKNLERQRKKIEKEINGYREDIVEFQMNNIELKRKIEENNKRKIELLNIIDKQSETVKKVSDKYSSLE